MDEFNMVSVLPKQSRDRFGVIDVPGDHKSSRAAVAAAKGCELSLGPQQHLLTDAAAVSQVDGPAQIASPPTFSLFTGERRNVSIGLTFTTVFHPAVLKTEFEGAHVAGGDQLTRLNTEIRPDLLNHEPIHHGSQPPSRTEAEIVGSKRCACESEPHSEACCQLEKGGPPGSSVGFFRVHSKVMSFIGDRQAVIPSETIQEFPERDLLATGCLVTHQQAIGSLQEFRLTWPALKNEVEARSGLLPLAQDRVPMTEDHKPPESPFLAEPLECQQCAKGLTGTGSCKDQNIGIRTLLYPSTQQSDQLLLPVTGPDRLAFRSRRKIEADGVDGDSEEDESF